MKLDAMVDRKIRGYKPKNSLDHTAKLVLLQLEVNHPETRNHCQRLAIVAEEVAKTLKKDQRAVFFGGLLHDVGKLVLPFNLFDGHNITAEEYAFVKRHPQLGYEILKKKHLFTALLADTHHAVYKDGYGLSIKDLPKKIGLGTVKKMLDLAMIISICDFIDAATNRKTILKDGSDKGGHNLRAMLLAKYPEEEIIIDLALAANKKLKARLK